MKSSTQNHRLRLRARLAAAATTAFAAAALAGASSQRVSRPAIVPLRSATSTPGSYQLGP